MMLPSGGALHGSFTAGLRRFFRMVEIRSRLEPLRVSTILTSSTNSYCVARLVIHLWGSQSEGSVLAFVFKASPS